MIPVRVPVFALTLPWTLPLFIRFFRVPSTPAIGKAAHKLLPITTMMQMGCLEELKDLSPEHIGEIEEAEIREKLKVVITTLSAAVSDLYAS